MNSYTIVKLLALCLGAVSVVSRALPEQQSEINARAVGGYGFSNIPRNQDNADAKIELSVFNTPIDVNDPRWRLEGMGRKVLSKRDNDFRQSACSNRCHPGLGDWPPRNPNDCIQLWHAISAYGFVDVPVGPNSFIHYRVKDCETGFFNLSNDTATHNLLKLAAAAESLNNSDEFCQTPIRTCNYDDLNFVVLSHPDWFIHWELPIPPPSDDSPS